MKQFKTITYKDWLHAVEDGTSERTKKMRHKKLALRALKEIEPFWLSEKEFPAECCMRGTYNTWKIRPFAKNGYFLVYIDEGKIWIVDVDGEGNKEYPCGKPDWSLDTNLA